MHRFVRRRLALALFVAGLLPCGAAFAGGDISVALTANRVTMSQGKEAYIPADHARPGETIEYRATYKNTGSHVAKDVQATLPVPKGLEYLPNTAAPNRLLASTDGSTFAPVPLMRRVKNADGSWQMRQVPAAEYRSLRWSVGDLAPNAWREVRARMRVSLEPVAVAAAH